MISSVTHQTQHIVCHRPNIAYKSVRDEITTALVLTNQTVSELKSLISSVLNRLSLHVAFNLLNLILAAFKIPAIVHLLHCLRTRIGFDSIRLVTYED